MAFYPHKFHNMLFVNLQKTQPQIGIFFAFKPLLHPIVNPAFRNRIGHIFRIGVNSNLTSWYFQCFQSNNHSQQFHAVIGGMFKALRNLLAEFARNQHNSIASRPGISAGSAIGVNCYLWTGHNLKY